VSQSQVLDQVGIFLAAYSQYILILILPIIFFKKSAYQFQNKVTVILALAAAIIARLGIKTIILFFYNHPRPFVLLSNVQPLIVTDVSENFQSFPSGHAIFFFALSTVIYRYNKSLGTFFFIFSLLMGVARIFVGVHWPADILGGAVLGVLVGLVVDLIYRKNEKLVKESLYKIFGRDIL
jgi:undecaprenyl-diphosphatase